MSITLDNNSLTFTIIPKYLLGVSHGLINLLHINGREIDAYARYKRCGTDCKVQHAAGNGGATMRQCDAMRRDLRQLRDMRNNAINTN